MKRSYWILVVVIALLLAAPPASAQQQRLIVRDRLGLSGINRTCLLLGCKVVRGLGDPLGQVFLITAPDINLLQRLLQLLPLQLGIVNVELDRTIGLLGPALGPIPSGLTDTLPVPYYGTVVWHGYLYQPGNQVVRTLQAQSTFRVSGAGTVALIDTGVDPAHPVFKGVLVPGYDFTRNTTNPDEKGDVNHSTAAVLDGGGPVYVNPWTAAVIDKSTAATLSDPKYSAFGHGTMTAGIVHMVAPTAKLMPLKAFGADGSGYSSDIVRAIYYAANNGAKVISMSFSFASASNEMATAVSYANSKSVICVASAGNDGQQIKVYPASLPGVIGVASTSDIDTLSTFSNYGSQVAWMAAPGEDILSAYPYGTYAASSGTSFSAPFVAGTAALLVNMSKLVTPANAAKALGHARYIAPAENHGRLDVYLALKSGPAGNTQQGGGSQH